MMKCEDCGKFRNSKLPSSYDDTWLNNNISIAWRCESCYLIAKAKKQNKTVQITENRRYLIKMSQVIPFLWSLAAIIMICLEIAWHS